LKRLLNGFFVSNKKLITWSVKTVVLLFVFVGCFDFDFDFDFVRYFCFVTVSSIWCARKHALQWVDIFCFS
jgi:hypothetical protein